LTRKLQLILIALLLCVGSVSAQEVPVEDRPTPTWAADRFVEFHFEGRAILAPRFGKRIEVLPVFELLGAEAAYSLAAGTYGVTFREHTIQFAIDHKVILVNGSLQEARDAPAASPGGVAVSVGFLERSLLSPIGYHLESIPQGYRIVPGARFAEPVTIRAAAADFKVTTTLVLTLNRTAEAVVEETTPGVVTVEFDDATPQLDATAPFRSRRVRSLTPTPTPAPVQVIRRAGSHPIVIDPGHGGDDFGASSVDGLAEKEVVLAIAHRLKSALEARGYPVRLTREGDDARALTDRTALANRLEARAFISLHANASTVSSVSGAETYYMSLDEASDEEAAATAALENRAGSSSSARSPLDLILWDLAQAEVLNESSDLALAVQGRLNAHLGSRDRGVKQAPFVVLTGATMPAILIEVGFLSNPSQARLMSSPEYQRDLAEAIARGIEDFVSR
jgi:N-acetylmuramoyl-L-alanine amidase